MNFWGKFLCESFHNYIYGMKVTIINDHKPLEFILRKGLTQAPPRLQRLMLRLQRYDFVMKYVPGKELKVADTLSRASLHDKESILHDDHVEIIHEINVIIDNLPISSERLKDLIECTKNDQQLQAVMSYVHNGWPQKKPSDQEVNKFWNIRNDLY